MSERKKFVLIVVLLFILLLNVVFDFISLFSKKDFTFCFFVIDILCFVVAMIIATYIQVIKGRIRFLYIGIAAAVIGIISYFTIC